MKALFPEGYYTAGTLLFARPKLITKLLESTLNNMYYTRILPFERTIRKDGT